MRGSHVRPRVRSTIGTSDDVICSQWIIRTSRLAADPARRLLAENLLTDAAVVGTETALRARSSGSFPLTSAGRAEPAAIV
jgi:hypothetical protein